MSFLNNLKRDALGTLQGLEPQNLLAALMHPGRTLGGMADFYGQLARHPIGTFENAPISSLLGVAPGVGVLGKLAKFRAFEDAGAFGALDPKTLRSPAEMTFADVSKAPPTSFDIMGESGYGESLVPPVGSMLDAIKQGPQFSGIPDSVVMSPEGQHMMSSWNPEGPNPVSPNQPGITSPQDVYDMANTADYVNPDAPNMNLMMDNHMKSIGPEDQQYQDYLDSLPEASGAQSYGQGLDYGNMTLEDFQNAGITGAMPPELDQFLRPYQAPSDALYRPDDQGGSLRLGQSVYPHFGQADPMLQQHMLHQMMTGAAPDLRTKLLQMLMQGHSNS